MIEAIALPNDILLEAKDHVGPTSILRGNTAKDHTNFASSVTLRYSDAPKNQSEIVLVKQADIDEEISAKSIEEEDYIKFRI